MKTVFIVDDEVYIRRSLSELINWNDLGFETPLLFSNANDALNAIESNPPFLIISDIKMPLMDGLDFAKTVYIKNNTINFFILSAYGEFGLAVKAIRYNVKRYFVKPISITELTSAILDLTEQRDSNSKTEYLSDYVIKYIETNISSATLKGAAKELGLTPNHLSYVFHKETGRTFSELLTERKMKLAISLIEKGADNKTAAEAIGYQDVQSFKRAVADYLKELL